MGKVEVMAEHERDALREAAELVWEADQCWHQKAYEDGEYDGEYHAEECAESVCEPCPLCVMRKALEETA